VWDADNGAKTTLVSKGAGVVDNSFGGEGTGGQSYLVYNWIAGNTYRFITRAAGRQRRHQLLGVVLRTGDWRVALHRDVEASRHRDLPDQQPLVPREFYRHQRLYWTPRSIR
jgi:hypothetical protein